MDWVFFNLLGKLITWIFKENKQLYWLNPAWDLVTFLKMNKMSGEWPQNLHHGKDLYIELCIRYARNMLETEVLAK